VIEISSVQILERDLDRRSPPGGDVFVIVVGPAQTFVVAEGRRAVRRSCRARPNRNLYYLVE
jgi:hypothetical protein